MGKSSKSLKSCLLAKICYGLFALAALLATNGSSGEHFPSQVEASRLGYANFLCPKVLESQSCRAKCGPLDGRAEQPEVPLQPARPAMLLPAPRASSPSGHHCFPISRQRCHRFLPWITACSRRALSRSMDSLASATAGTKATSLRSDCTACS